MPSWSIHRPLAFQGHRGNHGVSQDTGVVPFVQGRNSLVDRWGESVEFEDPKKEWVLLVPFPAEGGQVPIGIP